MAQRLVLIGADHAHMHVLQALARAPLPGTAVTLVTPLERQIYCGMLPGWLNGHYAIEQCARTLAPLARRAGVELRRAQVVGLDLARGLAFTDAGYSLDFDLLSIDAEPAMDRGAIAGAAEHALALQPLESFVGAWEQLRERLARSRGPVTLTVVGGGAGGIEVALAIAASSPSWQPRLRIQLVAGTAGVVPLLPPGARDRVLRALAGAAIRVIEDSAVEIGARTVLLAAGGELTTDGALLTTGATAAAWPGAAGLAVDRRGFIAVDPTLRSTSHRFVFAAGDCATMIEHPRPKSATYAARAGPPLARNLRRCVQRAPLSSYVPPARALNFLAVGQRRAIGIWGGFSFEGAWAWRWKDRIDRRFIGRDGRDVRDSRHDAQRR